MVLDGGVRLIVRSANSSDRVAMSCSPSPCAVLSVPRESPNKSPNVMKHA